MTRYFPNGQIHPNCANLYCTQPTQIRIILASGVHNFKPLCSSCTRAAQGKQKYKPRVKSIKKTYCENRDNRLNLSLKCPTRNLKILESYQLDLDHIDGNRENNHHTNIQTICSFCHREKTHNERNFVGNKYIRNN